MKEAAKHVILLAASLASLILGLLNPGVTYPLVLAALGLLVTSTPKFNYLYPQSHSCYEYIYRRYIARVLAVVYTVIVFLVQQNLTALALLIFVTVYSAASFLIGTDALVTSFLALIGFGGINLLLSKPPSPFSPLEEIIAYASIFAMFVLAPLFMAIYYTASKYYEKLYEYGRAPTPQLPLNLGISATGAIFLAGIFLAGVSASMIKDPLFMIPATFGGLGAAAFTCDVLRKLRGEAWSYTNYSDYFVEDAARTLKEKLEKTNWRYEVKKVWRRRGVSVTIYSPFKAKITVREWVHRGYLTVSSIRVPVKTGSGTIIEVSPGPPKAPRPLKKFMYSYLSALGLDREAAEWT